MTDPSDTAPQGNAPVAIRIVIAVICGLWGMIGLVDLGVVGGAFAYEGFRFLEPDRELMQIMIIASSMFIAPSIIGLGIILRYARWKKAPTASLVLAVIYLVSDIIGTAMLDRTLDPTDTQNRNMLLIWALVGLLIGALPPFLHWWKSRA